MIAAEVRNIEKRFQWFNHIPSNWEVMRLKNICDGKLQYGINIPANKYSDDGVRFLRTTDINEDGEVIPNGIYIPKKEVPESYILQKGDLLFSRSGTVGRCYLHDSDEEYCYAGFLVKFKPKNYLLSKLLYYTSLTKEFKYQIFSEAIESTISNFNGNKYAVLRVAFPSDENELKKLIDYLDFKYAEVKKFIQTKQRFIELLKEQRQSIITNAVTKGINDGVKMKETVLGKIPEHWQVRRLKFIAEVNFSTVDKHSHKEEKQVRLCNYVDVYKHEYITNDFDFMIATATEVEIKRFTVEKGDVIITKDSETAADIAIPALVVEDLENVVCAYHLAHIKPNKELVESEFLFRLFQSKKINSHFEVAAKGVTRHGLSYDDINSVFLPYPPTLKEQQEIIKHIKTETRTLDIAISKAEREIELIKEYREAMIAEAVTGKMKL